MPTHPPAPIAGSKSLEMTMRDVMEGLADSACQMAYGASALDIEILSLEAPRGELPRLPRAKVVPVCTARSQNIVDYLIQRENHLHNQAASA